MQTFWPFPSVEDTRKVLDYKRLGKQRVEGYQILNTLSGKSSGWASHTAVKMWRGFEPALFDYTIAMCEEWCSRGYTCTTTDKLFDEYGHLMDQEIIYPSWTTNPRVLDSHKAMLFHKDPIHYKQFAEYGAKIKDYYWPVN